TDSSGNAVVNTTGSTITVTVAKLTSGATITHSSGTALTIPNGSSQSSNSFTYSNAGVGNGGGSDTVTASATGYTSAAAAVSWSRPAKRVANRRPAGTRPLPDGPDAPRGRLKRSNDRLVQTGERDHDLRVELRARAAPELRQRLLRAHGGAIRPGGGHCDVGVADGDDPGGQRDGRPGEAVDVPGPVPALVRRSNDLRDLAKRRRAPEDPLGDERVTTHEPPFVLGQCARLAEDCVRDRDLPDVV